MIKDTKNKLTSFGGVYILNKIVNKYKLKSFIDRHFSERPKQSKYKDSNLLLGLSYSIFCGASYLEDVNYLRSQLHNKEELSVPSSDSIEYRIKQLSVANNNIISKKGIHHSFNNNELLNTLLCKLGCRLNPTWKKQDQMLDFDNTLIETRKKDSKFSYQHSYGYYPGVFFIDRVPVYIEGRNGHTNPKHKMDDVLKKALDIMEDNGIMIKYFRADAASCMEKIFEILTDRNITYYVRGINARSYWEIPGYRKKKLKLGNETIEVKDFPWSINTDKDLDCRLIVYRFAKKQNPQQTIWDNDNYRYYSIITNDTENSTKKIINIYNQRGTSEQNFDRLKNDFNWAHPPFSYLHQNTAYWIYTAMSAVIYYWLIDKISNVFTCFNKQTRIKRFMLYFINVCAKWIKQGGRMVLKLYTHAPYDILINSS